MGGPVETIRHGRFAAPLVIILPHWQSTNAT
jgi:hypothetical protein